MSEALDHVSIERAQVVMSALLRNEGTRQRLGVPDLQSCRFDVLDDCFHVVFEDLESADVPRKSLRDMKSIEVMDCKVDEYRRGVAVALIDGSMTSFSAEFARVFGDRAYREWVKSSKGDDARLARRVAERIRALRLKKHWTVAKLAQRAQMAAPNIHRLEAAKHVPSTQTLIRVSRALDVPLARLIEAKERKSASKASPARRQ